MLGLTETTHLREENEISVCADDQSDIFPYFLNL